MIKKTELYIRTSAIIMTIVSVHFQRGTGTPLFYHWVFLLEQDLAMGILYITSFAALHICVVMELLQADCRNTIR